MNLVLLQIRVLAKIALGQVNDNHGEVFNDFRQLLGVQLFIVHHLHKSLNKLSDDRLPRLWYAEVILNGLLSKFLNKNRDESIEQSRR